MGDAGGIVRLSDLEPIALGSRRRIFVLPSDPGTIVKVDRADWGRIPRGALTRLKRHVLPSTDERDKFVEAIEAMRVALRRQGSSLRLPVPAFRGFLNTDLGLGTMHERIRDETGDTAVPLTEWPRGEGARVDPPAQEALEDLVRRMMTLNLVVNDLHPGNVVIERGKAGPVCTLVDGYGDRATLRLRTMSPMLNTWKLHRRIAVFARGIGAEWDAEAMRFRVVG